MLGRRPKVLRHLKTGDWRSKLIGVSQGVVGCVALVGALSIATLNPLLLMAFSVAQALILLGVVCFVVVAVFAQRTLVLERYGPGELVFREGDPGQDVYVIKSGLVDVLIQRPDGGQEAVKRLGPTAHFGEMALLRNVPRSATIRTVTPVEVYKMSPGHFADLYTNLPVLRRYFRKIMRARLNENRMRGLGGTLAVRMLENIQLEKPRKRSRRRASASTAVGASRGVSDADPEPRGNAAPP